MLRTRVYIFPVFLAVISIPLTNDSSSIIMFLDEILAPSQEGNRKPVPIIVNGGLGDLWHDLRAVSCHLLCHIQCKVLCLFCSTRQEFVVCRYINDEFVMALHLSRGGR
jgi:hypothetical protein